MCACIVSCQLPSQSCAGHIIAPTLHRNKLREKDLSKVNGGVNGKSGFKPRPAYAKQSSLPLGHVALQVFCLSVPLCSPSSLPSSLANSGNRPSHYLGVRDGATHVPSEPVPSIARGCRPIRGRSSVLTQGESNRPRITSLNAWMWLDS